MRIAAIYDIHGNLPALEAVLQDIRGKGVDLIVVGGDVIPGPMPREAIAALTGLDVPVEFIQGNGEREALQFRGGGTSTTVPEAFHAVMRWVGDEISPEQARLLAAWPPTLRMEVPGVGAVLFCHATPRSDREIFTEATPEAALVQVFDPNGALLVICGRTHMQFDRRVGPVRVVNAGSVGMPFGAPGAYWLLLDHGVGLLRTEYDLTAAAEKIIATAYPQAAHFAESSVLHPPNEADMIALFERSAIGRKDA